MLLLLVAVLGSGVARGQAPYSTTTPNFGPSMGQPPYTPNNPLDEPNNQFGPADDPSQKPPTLDRPGTLSQWILGHTFAPCCLGPFGGDGPIRRELFGRVGAAIPFGGGPMARSLQTGVMVGAGGRSLFFNPENTQAWTLELGISSTWNHASQPDIQVPLSILVPPAAGQTNPTRANFGTGNLPGVTIRSLNRTFLNLGAGREYYLCGSAGCGTLNWRVGFDGGGRYGSEMADFNEIRHRTDTIAGVWAAVHTDLEIPCGCCTYYVGVRAEWDYTWSDILQGSDADVQGINLLFNFGVRF